jgi:hypothetical protein
VPLGVILGLVGGALVLVVGGAVVGILLIARAHRSIPASAWKEFTPPGGRCSVLMPGTPVLQRKGLLGLAVNGEVHGVELKKPDAAFFLAYFDLPRKDGKRIPMDERFLFAGAREGMISSSPDAIAEGEREVTLDGNPGREFTFTIKGKGKMMVRMYLTRTRLYGLLAGGSNIHPDSPDVKKFFDSFRIEGQPAAGEEQPAPKPRPLPPLREPERSRPKRPEPPVVAAPDDKDLQFAAKVDTLLTVVTDEGAGVALITTRDGLLKKYSYPGWEPQATYRLEQPAYRAALDGPRGLLYLAASPPESLEVFHYARREGGVGDLHVYNVQEVLRGKAPDGALLRPDKVVPLGGHVRHLILSPDRKVLYYLLWSGISSDAFYKPAWTRVGRIDAAGVDKGPEVDLKDLATCLCRTPDGRTLYAGATGRLRALNPATLETVHSAAVDTRMEDVAATDGGTVFLTAGGQWTEVRVVDMARGGREVGRWGTNVTGWTYLSLSPDQKRLYVGGDNHVRSLLVTGGLSRRPPELGAATNSDAGKVQGEFFVTEDGRFLVNRWGNVYRLARGGA